MKYESHSRFRNMTMQRWLMIAVVMVLGLKVATAAENTVRARDLGVPLRGEPGVFNAITDVAGVEVGHTTLISGDGTLKVGVGPIRTGVTVVLPRGRSSTTPVYAGWSTLNAAGEMTGTVWLEERGLLDGPIAITNTHSVGVARDALVGWMVEKGWSADWHVPVVAETWDGQLNDLNGFHVKPEHVRQALAAASSGAVPEGAVGGGTGMVCHQFKGGIGSSSRIVTHGSERYTVGVLVQCNYGDRMGLRIAGAPIGADLRDKYLPCKMRGAGDEDTPACKPQSERSGSRDGSIIVVIATDAPLLPHQLKRISKRAGLGLARMGSVAGAGSGDIFIAFSTANANLRSVEHAVTTISAFPNEDLTRLFQATVEATEESILNAMVRARDMTGIDDVKVYALPHEEVRAAMHRYGLMGAGTAPK